MTARGLTPLLLVLTSIVPRIAAAQPVPDVRPAEIGITGGGLTTLFADAPGGSIWMGRPLKNDWRLEGFVGFAEARRLRDSEDDLASAGAYGVQARNAFGRTRSERGEIYYSFGILGFFGRNRGGEVYQYESDGSVRLVGRTPDEPFFLPPVVAAVGIGAQRTIAPYLAVRADVQALVLSVIPIGARVSAGISVPFGRYAY